MYNFLIETLGSENKILKNEPLKNHTTFRTGGNAKYVLLPETNDEILKLVNYFKENSVKFYVFGNGSNILAPDEGYDGVIIKLGKNFSEIKVNDNLITACAGATLAKIFRASYENSLSGFEFASGIPGTLGGAVKMNAGAYGGEIKDVVISTKYLSNDGNISERKGDEQGFSYRHSNFSDDEVILSAVIKLCHSQKDLIKEKSDDLNSRRREKQPLEYPSAGSTFKRPEGYFAAKLIDDCGLRGKRIGGAMVSEKHCGFIINYDNATSGDILNLIDFVKQTVYKKTGVMLEEEVKLLK